MERQDKKKNHPSTWRLKPSCGNPWLLLAHIIMPRQIQQIQFSSRRSAILFHLLPVFFYYEYFWPSFCILSRYYRKLSHLFANNIFSGDKNKKGPHDTGGYFQVLIYSQPGSAAGKKDIFKFNRVETDRYMWSPGSRWAFITSKAGAANCPVLQVNFPANFPNTHSSTIRS